MPVRPNIESLITPSNSQSQGTSSSSNAHHQASDVEETDDASSTSDEDKYDYPPTQQHSVASSIHRVISADPYPEQRPHRSYSPAQSTSSRATSNTGTSSEVSLSSSRGSFPYRRKTKDSIPETYELVVVQQPSIAAEFGNHGVSRIPIAPPLMVQLIIRNNSGTAIPADDELAFLIAHVTLHKAALPDGMPDPQTSGITGTTTANAFTLNDLNHRRGNFFIFPDIGIQVQGRWRLQIKLMRIAAPGASSILTQGGTGNVLTCTWTEPFEVVPVEGYIAPKVTDLTRHFQSQGVRMFMSNSVVIH